MTRYTVLGLALLALTGCAGRQEAEQQTVPIETGRETASLPHVIVPKIPDGPYLITNDEDEDPVRRMVEVTLKEKVTPEVLREIAQEVKGKEKRQHERTAIFYYLPAEFPEIAGVPWATTTFRPSLEVKIVGFSREEEATMRKIPLDHKGKRIGAWLQDNQYKTLDLIYDDGGIKIAEIQLPAARSDTDMVELDSSKGRRFQKVNGSNFYDIDRDGILRISNANDQVFSVARPMK